MNNISKTKLGELIEFQRGYDLPKSEMVEGIYPVRSSNGILGYHHEYKVNGPGITIGRSGTVGIPHLIKSNFYPHNTSLFIKDFKGNDVSYIFYLLTNLKLNDRKTGSGVPTMNRNHLHPLDILAHLNISTQKKIAKVLSDLDAKIEVNNKINQELEAMAKTLYDYWFVQFDFPDASGKPYKSSGGKMVFHKELKREIPEGWEVESMNEILDVQYGYPFSTKLFSDNNGGKAVIRIRDILNNTVSTYSTEEVDKKYRLEKKDLVIGMDGNFHMNFWNDNNSWLNQRCVRVREKSESKISIYQAYQDIEPYIKAREENVSRTTVGHLSAKDINGLKVLLAPENKHFQHIRFFDSIVEKIIDNRVENQKLAELRDWLLPMLMNGQVCVGEVKEDVEIESEAKLNLAAEASPVFSDSLFGEEGLVLNYDYEVAAILLLTHRQFGFTYGKKYIHKMFSNIELANTMPVFQDIIFEENGWGMFSRAIEKTINNGVFIQSYITSNGTSILKVKSSALREVANWIKQKEKKEFVNQVNDMLTLYEKPLIGKEMDRIELLNTVLECMKVLETDNFEAIRLKMKNWRMTEEGYTNKAEKFKVEETRYMIQFIKDEIMN